ncbi:hypothetical protein KFE98_17195 [bacterium SCSIO 12741]|nr:hypothetical protein KFE98_17195 [bacterium SCSIO 12741]
MKVSTHSTIHKRMKCFVDFIAPEKEKRDKIKQQSAEIRACIEKHAKEDGYTIASSAYSGSFAKKTGLRRYLLGKDEVEGQDIDIVFLLEDKDKDGNALDCMIHRFKGYLKKCYPDSEISNTKSSATIHFTGSKQNFDAVPLIKTNRENIQKLIRTEGTDRQSSAQKQVEFIRKRNRSSNEVEGVVRFNDCLRLVKWWRYHMQSESDVFGNHEGDKKVPSFLLDLLCAKAYDKLGVKATYAETLFEWFDYLTEVVRDGLPVVFGNHQPSDTWNWEVIDPMDRSNNIAEDWCICEIDELTYWLNDSANQISNAIASDSLKNDSESLLYLTFLFGDSIKNQCKNV